MTAAESPAFAKVIDAIKSHVSKPRQPFDPNSRMLQEALGKAKDAWLTFVLDVALNRRKHGTAESPDGLVFTATQLHNYLNEPAHGFGIPCPYPDAVFLALFLCGETKMKHTLESIKHYHSKLIYDEDDDEDDGGSDSDSEEDDTDDGSDSDWEDEAVETDEEVEPEENSEPADQPKREREDDTEAAPEAKLAKTE